jgi:hypothetical protein
VDWAAVFTLDARVRPMARAITRLLLGLRLAGLARQLASGGFMKACFMAHALEKLLLSFHHVIYVPWQTRPAFMLIRRAVLSAQCLPHPAVL